MRTRKPLLLLHSRLYVHVAVCMGVFLCVCVRASRRVFVCCSQTNSIDVVSTWRALIINTDKAREGLACSMNKPRGWAGGQVVALTGRSLITVVLPRPHTMYVSYHDDPRRHMP